MPIEHVFGVLKGRWRILLNKIPGHLQNVPHVVGTCIVLHNLCLIFKDSFDGAWLSGLEGESPDNREVGFLKESMGANIQRLIAHDREVVPGVGIDLHGGYQSAVHLRDRIAQALYEGSRSQRDSN